MTETYQEEFPLTRKTIVSRGISKRIAQKIIPLSQIKHDDNLLDLLNRICPRETTLEPELLIQMKRIFFILDKAIAKMNLVICFHLLIEDNAELIRENVENEDEIEFVLDVLYDRFRNKNILKEVPGSKIWKSLDKISFYNIVKNEEKVQEDPFESEKRFDPHMAQVISILWKSPGIREFVHEQASHVKDSEALEFIQCLKRLRDLMEERLSLTSAQEIARQKQLKMAYRSNLMLLAHIKEFGDQLEKQREELNSELEKRQETIEYYRSRIEELKENFKADVAKKVTESERKMTAETQASELRQQDLAQEAKMVTQQYNSMLEEHLSEEKVLRAKRLKIEAQLAAWLAKYDSDVGDKQAEFEAIQKEYDKEKEEMDALQDLMDEQEDEYTILMTEKEEEEQRIFNEMAYQFLMHRSARRIQRYWRAYRERKLARKKRRGKKKTGEAKKGAGAKKGAVGKREKKKKDERIDIRAVDPNAALAGAFNKELLEDIKDENAFKGLQ